MIIYRKIGLLKKHLARLRNSGKLGFVPTMGALHQGHLELIKTSKKENEHTLCSIFINPTQFNDPQDFQKYPKTLESDIALLEASGCHILFLPEVEEIYPGGLQPEKHYDLGVLEKVFEGKFRPGHFQGVCRVVDILLGIVEPHKLYLGQKDYQQCMVIRRLIEITRSSVQLRICETVREKDGLAMSSRNLRLSAEQRKIAPEIFQTMSLACKELKAGPLEGLAAICTGKLSKAGFRPEYFAFANARSLEPKSEWNGVEPLVVLVAAFLGEIRLIDNMILNSAN